MNLQLEINLLTKLKGFKLMTTLVVEFKKTKNDDNAKPFIQTQKQKQLLMRVILIMYLHQFIVRLYQTYKNLKEKVLAGLLIQS